MMWDLDHQDHWQRHKDEVQKQWDDYWAEHQRQSGEQFHGTPTAGDNIQLEGTPYPVDGQMFPKQEARHPWRVTYGVDRKLSLIMFIPGKSLL
jgi:hypothetical protein